MLQLMQLSADMHASVARHLLQIKDLISFARLCNKALRVQLAAEFVPVIEEARNARALCARRNARRSAFHNDTNKYQKFQQWLQRKGFPGLKLHQEHVNSSRPGHLAYRFWASSGALDVRFGKSEKYIFVSDASNKKDAKQSAQLEVMCTELLIGGDRVNSYYHVFVFGEGWGGEFCDRACTLRFGRPSQLAHHINHIHHTSGTAE